MFGLTRHLKILPRLVTECWHVGIVHQSRGALLDGKALQDAKVTWLPPSRPFHFIADPFGIFHEGLFTVFVEALDYRVKRGVIHYYSYDAASWELRAKGVALETPFHLSYPTILRDGNAIYMLPEAHRSGKLTLYRAVRFPDQWEPVAVLMDAPVIDASVIQHAGKWWMFYALPGPDDKAMRELHVASSAQLTGPWKAHAQNPVRTGLDSSRPGGMPFVHEGALYLPTQNCVGGYGKSIQLLRIDVLTDAAVETTPVQQLLPQGLHPEYPDGLHTLSGEQGVTLVDVKRMQYCHRRRSINWQRRVRRLVGSR